jgi:hypothetical protein
VEILWVSISCLTLGDLAELEPAENMTDFFLFWNEGLYIKEVFLVLKRWRQLRRLSLTIYENSPNNNFPPFEVLSDFIMKTKQLSFLSIRLFVSNDGQLETLRDKVNELILPRRPNFQFDVSCWDDRKSGK